LLRSALLQEYGLQRAEAAEVCECLRVWFHGFFRRPGTPHTVERLRPHLLSMACNAGHTYWSSRRADEIPADNNVKRSLSLGPEKIATELEKAVEEREKSGGDAPMKETS
jgi:hypothetical protein